MGWTGAAADGREPRAQGRGAKSINPRDMIITNGDDTDDGNDNVNAGDDNRYAIMIMLRMITMMIR